jgi:hypothetical protein
MSLRHAVLLSVVLVSACSERNFYDGPSGQGNPNAPTRPSDPNPPRVITRIEFRVTGNALGARVRISNAVDGLSQITTTLPYVTTITTLDESMFLSIEATPTAYASGAVFPFFAVQIFADGKLFREATSNDFTLTTLAVSGTWRK